MKRVEAMSGKNWQALGLCDEKMCNGNCEYADAVLNGIDEMKDIYLFRSLSMQEINKIPDFERDTHPGINLEKQSLHCILYDVFDCCRITVNNSKGKTDDTADDKGLKQYSYSKSMIIPLFKYHEEAHGFGFKKMPVNVFHSDENDIVPIREFFLHKRSRGSFAAQKSGIYGFTLDLSVFDEENGKRRFELTVFYRGCVGKRAFKTEAAFGKDKEVISSTPFDCCDDAAFFADQKKLNYLRFIIFVKIFLFFNANYGADEARQKIWAEWIETVHKRTDALIEASFNENEKGNVLTLLRLLEKNKFDEYGALGSVYSTRMDCKPPQIAALEKFLPALPGDVGYFHNFINLSKAAAPIKNFAKDVNEMIESSKQV